MCIALRNLEIKKLEKLQRDRNPRRDETNFDLYADRVGYDSNAEANDTNARWDRHRASLPKPIRSRTPRAAEAVGPETTAATGWRGNWHGALRFSTPGFGRRRRKPIGAMPRSGPGKF